MTREIFTETLVGRLKEKLGNQYEIRTKHVRKNNGYKRECILLRKMGESAAPVVDTESLYRAYLNGSTWDQIIRMILSEKEVREEVVLALENMNLMDYESVKDHILFRLVHAGRNRELLQTIPHILYLDLAIVFYIQVTENTVTIINGQIMKLWTGTQEIDITDIYQIAKENTQRICPPHYGSLQELLFGRQMDPAETIEPIYMLTNTSGAYGASCILYDNVLKEIAQIEGSDLWVIPSSTHEVLLMPDMGENKDSLIQMVRSVNETAVPEEDILSDTVYHYSMKEQKLEMVAEGSGCA